MRTLLAVLFLLLLRLTAAAHPGWGIVRDSRGNVFYTDLVHVWRIAPNGQKSIAVRNVHTHELALDAADNLYGEDTREQAGQYRYRIWKRSPAGALTDERPWTNKFRDDYGIVRDARGTTYFARCQRGHCRPYQRTAAGRISPLLSAATAQHSVARVAPAPDGSLYFIENRALRRLSPQKQLTTVAARVASVDTLTGVFGLWPDARGHVYVAAFDDRQVKRVSPQGQVTTVMRTPPPWQPTGVCVAPSGDYWVLEYAGTRAQVRRVTPAGVATVF